MNQSSHTDWIQVTPMVSCIVVGFIVLRLSKRQ
jgi:hypothetical protein